MQKKHRPLLNTGALLGGAVVLVFLWAFLGGGMDQNPWRLLPPFLAVVVLGVAVIVLRAKRRIKTLQRVAGELGLVFNRKGDESSMAATFDPIEIADEKAALEKLMSELGAHSLEVRKMVSDQFVKTRSSRGLEQSELRRLTLFQGVDHPRATNVMAGRLAETEAIVFDYGYYTRQIDPSSSTRVSQTVAAFRFRGTAFPAFELSREGLLPSTGQDLDFVSHPTFSKRFQLRGDDESALREFFNVDLLHFFEGLDQNFDQTVEGGGECIVVYHHGRLIRPEAIKDFVQQASAIASALARANPRPRPGFVGS